MDNWKDEFEYIDEDEITTIELYRLNKIRICKQLGQWKNLTLQEQLKFKKSVDKNEMNQLMITSRKRTYDKYLNAL